MRKKVTENDTVEISKSQRKREAHEMLELARKLVAMPTAALPGLPLDAELRREVAFARDIRAHGARKRQLMTVAKILRNRDSSDILQAVNEADQRERRINARQHHIEAWRDCLINGNDRHLSALLGHDPVTDVQVLRQLIRNAKRESRLGKPPASARKLFRLLRDLEKLGPLPPLPTDP